MRKPSLKILQKKCDDFNSKVSLGDNVRVKLDNGELRTTKTRSDAQVLSGHSAVIWLEGITGCYLLDRVSPARDGSASV